MSAPAPQHCVQGQRARHQDHQELPQHKGSGAAATAQQRLGRNRGAAKPLADPGRNTYYTIYMFTILNPAKCILI